MKLDKTTAGRLLPVLCLLLVAVYYFLRSVSWSLPDSQIEKDFAAYWEKIGTMFTDATLIEQHITSKNIGLQTAEVTIKYVWERKKTNDRPVNTQRHDSEITFIYKKQGDRWKLVKREDLIFLVIPNESGPKLVVYHYSQYSLTA